MKSEMVEITDLLTIQLLLKNMLHDFHCICEEYELVYNIFGGTMLGAVRHQGFIPWDDDVDLTMPRDDYEKLLNIDLSDTDYEIKCYPMKGYVFPFAKFCLKSSCLIEHDLREEYSHLGLFIDIFPVDGYPDSKSEKSYFKKRLSYKQKRCFACMKPKPSSNRFRKLFYPIRLIQYMYYNHLGYEQYLRKEIELSKQYSINDSEYLSCFGAGWGAKGKIKKEVYYDRVLVDFDDIQVWSLKDYDQHLRNLYGDYMILPEKSKRNTIHNFNLYVDSNTISKMI